MVGQFVTHVPVLTIGTSCFVNWVRFRISSNWCNVFINRPLADGKESAETKASDFQLEAAEKDREYDSTASALEGKRELNAEETARLKQLWKKLVRIFHPDLHEHDPEKSGNFERLEGRVMAESWTAESFLKNDWSNWRWNIFTGKWLQCLVRRFFLPPNPMILLFMILPQSICLTQAINEARDEEKGRYRAVGTHRQGPAGVHPETRLGQRFAGRVARAGGNAVLENGLKQPHFFCISLRGRNEFCGPLRRRTSR